MGFTFFESKFVFLCFSSLPGAFQLSGELLIAHSSYPAAAAIAQPLLTDRLSLRLGDGDANLLTGGLSHLETATYGVWLCDLNGTIFSQVQPQLGPSQFPPCYRFNSGSFAWDAWVDHDIDFRALFPSATLPPTTPLPTTPPPATTVPSTTTVPATTTVPPTSSAPSPSGANTTSTAAPFVTSTAAAGGGVTTSTPFTVTTTPSLLGFNVPIMKKFNDASAAVRSDILDLRELDVTLNTLSQNALAPEDVEVDAEGEEGRRRGR